MVSSDPRAQHCDDGRGAPPLERLANGGGHGEHPCGPVGDSELYPRARPATMNGEVCSSRMTPRPWIGSSWDYGSSSGGRQRLQEEEEEGETRKKRKERRRHRGPTAMSPKITFKTDEGQKINGFDR